MKADELTTHPLFQLCNQTDQKFLQRYLQTRDMFTSIAEIYKPRSVSAVARKLQADDVIATLLSIIVGKSLPTKEDLVRKVWHTLNAAKRPHEVWRGAEILSDLSQWGVTPKPTDEAEERRQKAKQLDADRMVPAKGE